MAFNLNATSASETPTTHDQLVKKSLGSERRSGSVCLSSLPIDVLSNIIRFVQLLSCTEVDHIRKLKWARIQDMYNDIEQLNQPENRSYSYIHQEAPILSTIQALSVTDRLFYSLCRPSLWKSIKFPTQTPVPMCLWTESLLPRHGHLTRSISLVFSARHHYEDPAFENTIVITPYTIQDIRSIISSSAGFPNERQQPLSLANVTRVVSQCPRLASLVLIRENLPVYPDNPDQATGTDIEFLVTLMSKLIHLHRFKLEVTEDWFPDEGMVRILGHLPHLQSLDLTWVGQEGDAGGTEGKSLGFCITQLKHLSRLHLCLVKSVTEKWLQYPWPQTITDLGLQDCQNLATKDIPRLIQNLAPRLTRLALCIRDKEISKRWPNTAQCDFPTLLNLDLYTPYDSHVLFSFQSCKNLCRLAHRDLFRPDFQAVQEIICASTWPRLESILVNQRSIRYVDENQQQDHDQVSKKLLREFCKRTGIRQDDYD